DLAHRHPRGEALRRRRYRGAHLGRHRSQGQSKEQEVKVGILGTGDVGRALGTGFVTLGHEVRIGARSPNHEKALEWAGAQGRKASQGTFADAPRFGEMMVMATLGAANPEVVKAAGPAAFSGKVVIDATNPLDFSKGFPPDLNPKADDSGGEVLQRLVP